MKENKVCLDCRDSCRELTSTPDIKEWSIVVVMSIDHFLASFTLPTNNFLFPKELTEVSYEIFPGPRPFSLHRGIDLPSTAGSSIYCDASVRTPHAVRHTEIYFTLLIHSGLLLLCHGTLIQWLPSILIPFHLFYRFF